jgi:hypothetical protein
MWPSRRTFRALGRLASLRLTLDYGLTAAWAQTQLIANAIGDKNVQLCSNALSLPACPENGIPLLVKGLWNLFLIVRCTDIVRVLEVPRVAH